MGTVRRNDPDQERLTTGQRLSWLMRDRGVTATRLAANLRIQMSTLGNFRGGYRSIPSDVVAGMARELRTNVDFLLERSEDARPGEVIQEEARTRMEGRRSR
jgi:transcriptional regulator with XRE-family HTH domain